MQLSNRLLALADSQSLAMAQRAAEMKAQGIDVISLSLGEPDFTTPEHIKEAAKVAIDQNFSYYAPVPGYPSLKKAIAAKLLNENHLTYEPDQIIVSTGGKQAICNAVLALINPGDEVILPTPCWVSYSEMVKLAEGTPVFVETTHAQNFKMSGAQLEAAITPKTKMLILCSPSNPSGAIYSKDELADLAAVLERHPEVLVISDEMYEHITYVGQPHSLAEWDSIKSQIIIANGVSKAYAMTGWRIGWIAADKKIVNACKKLQSQYTSCASTIAMKAAEAAYLGPQDCVETMRLAFQRRRDLVLSLIREIPGFECTVPDGAFYVFPVVSALFGKKTPSGEVITNSSDLANYLLSEAHVAAVDGAAFMSPECIRFSYATSEEKLTDAFTRVKNAVLKLS